ncbi:hypothetical protein MMOR_25510 [Mycolicibacterium moriokaense]|jgi:hypothetical protein|uniref:DUF732 domain-containing protein n=2 Tax=Mycolicibacterium moriokaense TaxID=39691 RepID=A0AAD1HA65_9MYCO|nr:DUF732 domain-containing protein [Mycolicibacterium moriokaense]BBX01615.1 hypothetical protein MMOR_25510 [Mycolicibacterium moriokaense]
MTLVGVATALSLAAPASAEPVDTSFLNALNDAGIGYGDPVSAEKLGQSICPMLVEPGKNLASVYSTVSDNGINPDVAAFFTGIAISAYCPSMMAQIGNGTILEGLNGIPGLRALGLPGF